MLADADLDSAVAAGIVTQAQAVSLREIAARRVREQAIAQGHEERFRFMRGFNDVFFAIGVVLFVLGLTYFIGSDAGGRLVIAAIVWALAELLVGRLRLVLPGIILAVAFVVLVFLGIPAETWLGVQMGSMGRPQGFLDALGSTPGLALVVMIKGLVAAAAAGAFYWRFKLPFALLPLAASLVLVALAAVSKIVPSTTITDPLVLLACALAVFAAAMAFDSSDRERVTRRADCAFWLHLLAAPLIVHSLIWLMTPLLSAAPSRGPGAVGLNMTPGLALAIVLIFVAMAAVAILIDRRALLVSGLTYLGAAIGFALTGAGGNPSRVPLALAGTLTLLGALVLVLGVGWMPLRRRLIQHLPTGLTGFLPPTPAYP